jgi:hypothetical protein
MSAELAYMIMSVGLSDEERSALAEVLKSEPGV